MLTCRRLRFISGGSGHPEGRPFPWLVSDFGLVDAIESGIVKIPRLPVMDTTGLARPEVFQAVGESEERTCAFAIPPRQEWQTEGGAAVHTRCREHWFSWPVNGSFGLRRFRTRSQGRSSSRQ